MVCNVSSMYSPIEDRISVVYRLLNVFNPCIILSMYVELLGLAHALRECNLATLTEQKTSRYSNGDEGNPYNFWVISPKNLTSCVTSCVGWA